MKSITTTELRVKTKELVELLKNGEIVDIIHRSKVIGAIHPVKEEEKNLVRFSASRFQKFVEKLNKDHNIEIPDTKEERRALYFARLMEKHGKGLS